MKFVVPVRFFVMLVISNIGCAIAAAGGVRRGFDEKRGLQACTDDDTFKYYHRNKKKGEVEEFVKGCGHVARKPKKRCRKKITRGERVRDRCPYSCGECHASDRDIDNEFILEGNRMYVGCSAEVYRLNIQCNLFGNNDPDLCLWRSVKIGVASNEGTVTVGDVPFIPDPTYEKDIDDIDPDEECIGSGVFSRGSRITGNTIDPIPMISSNGCANVVGLEDYMFVVKGEIADDGNNDIILDFSSDYGFAYYTQSIKDRGIYVAVFDDTESRRRLSHKLNLDNIPTCIGKDQADSPEASPTFVTYTFPVTTTALWHGICLLPSDSSSPPNYNINTIDVTNPSARPPLTYRAVGSFTEGVQLFRGQTWSAEGTTGDEDHCEGGTLLQTFTSSRRNTEIEISIDVSNGPVTLYVFVDTHPSFNGGWDLASQGFIQSPSTFSSGNGFMNLNVFRMTFGTMENPVVDEPVVDEPVVPSPPCNICPDGQEIANYDTEIAFPTTAGDSFAIACGEIAVQFAEGDDFCTFIHADANIMTACCSGLSPNDTNEDQDDTNEVDMVATFDGYLTAASNSILTSSLEADLVAQTERVLGINIGSRSCTVECLATRYSRYDTTCTDRFSDEELNGISHCYSYEIVFTDELQDGSCDVNEAVELCEQAFRDGEYSETCEISRVTIWPPTGQSVLITGYAANNMGFEFLDPPNGFEGIVAAAMALTQNDLCDLRTQGSQQFSSNPPCNTAFTPEEYDAAGTNICWTFTAEITDRVGACFVENAATAIVNGINDSTSLGDYLSPISVVYTNGVDIGDDPVDDQDQMVDTTGDVAGDDQDQTGDTTGDVAENQDPAGDATSEQQNDQDQRCEFCDSGHSSTIAVQDGNGGTESCEVSLFRQLGRSGCSAFLANQENVQTYRTFCNCQPDPV